MKRLAFFSLSLSLFAFSACSQLNPFAKKTGTIRWGEMPVPIYFSPSLAKDSKAVADLGAATQFWEGKAGQKVFDYKGAWQESVPPVSGTLDNPDSIDGNVIFLVDDWKWGKEVAGKTIALNKDSQIQGAMIVLQRGLRFCLGPCAGNQDRAVSLRRLLTHELGHLIGLNHSTDPNDIMFANLKPDGDIGASTYDATALKTVLEPFD